MPSDGDKPLRSDILPALHLTAVLVSAAGAWRLYHSPTAPFLSSCSSQRATSHRGVPGPAVSRGCRVEGGVENQLCGFTGFVNRRKQERLEISDYLPRGLPSPPRHVSTSQPRLEPFQEPQCCSSSFEALSFAPLR